MKTPDEIRNGLEHCYSDPSCVGCPDWGDGDCNVESNALAYIQQLEQKIAELTAQADQVEAAYLKEEREAIQMETEGGAEDD